MTYRPEHDLMVCPHWESTCVETQPVQRRNWDWREPPLCDLRHVMDVQITLRQWQAGPGWPR